MEVGLPTTTNNKGGIQMDNNSLAHSKWNCKYHIVFAPKYRRQVIYGQIKADIGRILRKLCEQSKELTSSHLLGSRGCKIFQGQVSLDFYFFNLLKY